MRNLLKTLMFLLLAADAALFAGMIAGIPAVGIFIALVLFMVGALVTYDWFAALEHECTRCGRSSAFGRLILLGEWFREEHESCPICGASMMIQGDRLE